MTRIVTVIPKIWVWQFVAVTGHFSFFAGFLYGSETDLILLSTLLLKGTEINTQNYLCCSATDRTLRFPPK
jgi:hypothetical protein